MLYQIGYRKSDELEIPRSVQDIIQRTDDLCEIVRGDQFIENQKVIRHAETHDYSDWVYTNAISLSDIDQIERILTPCSSAWKGPNIKIIIERPNYETVHHAVATRGLREHAFGKLLQPGTPMAEGGSSNRNGCYSPWFPALSSKAHIAVAEGIELVFELGITTTDLREQKIKDEANNRRIKYIAAMIAVVPEGNKLRNGIVFRKFEEQEMVQSDILKFCHLYVRMESHRVSDCKVTVQCGAFTGISSVYFYLFNIMNSSSVNHI